VQKAAEIADKCMFRVGDIGNSVKTWSNGGNNIGRPKADGNDLVATVKFTNLPLHNDDFGWKTVWLEYNNLGEQRGKLCSATYGVFFPKKSNNHPQCDVCIDCEPEDKNKKRDNCPNWFYYWKDGNVCGIPPGKESTFVRFDNESMIAAASKDGTRIALGLKAADTQDLDFLTARTKTKEDNDLLPKTNYPPITIHYGKGIWYTAGNVKHETDHNKHTKKQFYVPVTNFTDTDKDIIPDILEISNYMGVNTATNTPDTYLLGKINSDYNEYGDEELRCRIDSKNFIFPVFPNKDWANPGCQHKDQYGEPVQE